MSSVLTSISKYDSHRHLFPALSMNSNPGNGWAFFEQSFADLPPRFASQRAIPEYRSCCASGLIYVQIASCPSSSTVRCFQDIASPGRSRLIIALYTPIHRHRPLCIVVKLPHHFRQRFPEFILGTSSPRLHDLLNFFLQPAVSLSRPVFGCS